MCVILDVDDDEMYKLKVKNKNDLIDYMKQHVSCLKKARSKKKVKTPKASVSSCSDTKPSEQLTIDGSGRIVVEFEPNVDSSGRRQSSRKKKLNLGYLQD